MNRVDQLAQKIWDYMLLHQPLEPADVIIVFGSYNPAVAHRAAELYRQGYAPRIIFSGRRSDSTNQWPETEAETFARIAELDGVPAEAIWLETRAINSGQNTQFSRALLEEKGLEVKKIIVVQKPYAERRAFATVKKQWPEVEVMVTSPSISYQDYMAQSPRGKNGSINTMVGDLQRIKIYPDQGWQIPQEIPAEVWQAYEELVRLGFDKSLRKD